MRLGSSVEIRFEPAPRRAADGNYQGLSEYKPDAQASASILAYTRLRFGLVLVRNYLLLALVDR